MWFDKNHMNANPEFCKISKNTFFHRTPPVAASTSKKSSSVNNTCLKSTNKTAERWRSSGVFIVKLEHISHLFLVFLLLTLIK